jgi:site-specific DNA-methyltransferase (adenine-specific)
MISSSLTNPLKNYFLDWDVITNMPHAAFHNMLYYGNNLEILRDKIDDESVDLIYLDPPFNSDQVYNIFFKERNGAESQSQSSVFNDTWKWGEEAEEAYEETVTSGGKISDLMVAFRSFLHEDNLMAYLSMMAPRLIELHRVLKPTGSIFLHCDPTASHYLKLLLDSVFSPENFKNEIIWRRTGNNKSEKRFGPLHQTILFYSKSNEAFFEPYYGPYTKEYVKKSFKDNDDRGAYQSVILTGPGLRGEDTECGMQWRHYNPASVGRHWQFGTYVYWKYKQLTGEDLSKFPLLNRLDKLDDVGLIHWGKKESVPRYKYYLADALGVPIQDIWAFIPGTKGCVYGNDKIGIDEDVKWLSTGDKERLGYPTQKPEGLLERIINSSCPPDGIVLDPFCGCGTTIAVAQRLNRKWIGIDVTHIAIALIRKRLADRYGQVIQDQYHVEGVPKSVLDATALAELNKYQFQWWVIGQLGATGIERKGADGGIDGRLIFLEHPSDRKPKYILISVKGGGVQVKDIRDLRGTMDREKAAIGVLISLKPPTTPMIKEASKAGFYQFSGIHSENYPRIQILTIEQFFNGERIKCPPYVPRGGNITFKSAQKIELPKGRKVKQMKIQ